MQQINTYKDKDILVLGLGKSGYAVSKLLLKLNARVVLTDQKNLTNDLQAQYLINLGVQVISAKKAIEIVETKHFDYLVKNPGVTYDNALVKRALALEIPIITEPEVALKASSAPYVCVTGSNGKTTTVMLVQRMLDEYLKKTGHHAFAVGNIGTPVAEIVPKATKDDYLVVELSSFQLLGITDIKPKIAAIVDIYNNVHLDYHKTFSNYVAAKLRITQAQDENDYFLANFDQKEILEKEKQITRAKIKAFSENDPQADYFISDECLESTTGPIIKKADIKLPGLHNQQNALVASAIAQILGVPIEIIQNVLKTFSGAKHRLQYVTTINGRKVYNDSKSTNVEAASVAIPAFDEPEVWLAGGLDRGLSFTALIPFLKKHVKAAVFYGQTRNLLADVAKKAGIKDIVITEDLSGAVKQAYHLSSPGDVLLFSPACASWDQFKTFEERGDLFIKLIRNLEIN